MDTNLRQISGACRSSIAVRERAERFETFGDGRREPLLAGQLRDEEDVLGRRHLVGAMRATCGTESTTDDEHPPNCWMALSALQGSSSVMCTRRR